LRTSRRTATLAIFAASALALSACGNGEEETDTGATAPENGAAAENGNGEAEAEPVADIQGLTGEQTEVIVDPSFVEGITGLGLTPGVVGEATFDEATGTFGFPITGGDVTVYEPGTVDPYVQGLIEHTGSGLSLSDGTTTVELTDFEVDPGESMLMGTVTANGEVAAEDAPLFFLDGSTLQPLQVNEAEGNAVLDGTTVSLTEEAAELLNETFETDALEEFFLVGTARITVALS
jgi:hypothetical protein